VEDATSLATLLQIQSGLARCSQRRELKSNRPQQQQHDQSARGIWSLLIQQSSLGNYSLCEDNRLSKYRATNITRYKRIM
jgi:hypothetical protein